ncbi:12599_t:CDS:10, partial [Racocetra fulgida]
SLEESEHQLKSEYSLQQHLANNLIDLYINLPSKNRYRRPASYMSRGYRTRRMAVDYDIPLITNVKCAKLFIEALSRENDFEILNIDYKTCHKRMSLPGLINVSTFIPHVAESDNDDFAQITKASLAAGFTTINILPLGLNESLRNARTIEVAHNNSRNNAHCDFSLSVIVTENNAQELMAVVPDGASSFIPFKNIQADMIPKMATVSKHLSTWPPHSPIVTDAKGTDLASVLLLASLHNRAVHVTDVSTKEDIVLIALSKEKGLKVTCDVSVYALFLNSNDMNGSESILPSLSDQAALWEYLESIDCFSVGTLPYRLSQSFGFDVPASTGIEETLPLLLNAVNDGKLTLDDIKTRLYTNPQSIFNIPEQPDTSVEVEIDRKVIMSQKEGGWSPFIGKTLSGAVSRVVLRRDTVYLDGGSYSVGTCGNDISNLIHVIAKTPVIKESFASKESSQAQQQPHQQPSQPVVSHVPDILSPTLTPREFGLKSMASDLFSLDLPHAVLPTITSNINQTRFFRQHILTAKDFSRNDLHLLFGVAHEMRTLVERYGSVNLLQGRVMFTLFFEPSTRTSASFEAAMNRLGGRVVAIKTDSSSVAKGESLADTIRTVGSYGDIIILRHPEPGSIKTAARYSPVPIINAGDGIGEHPTQAFLDVYTIREELGTVNGLTVTLVGDLKNGRTVHSLVRVLSQYQVALNYVSPTSLRIPDEIKTEVRKRGVRQKEYTDLESVLAETDVLYVTRIQRERFTDPIEYERVKDSYTINNATLSRSKPNMIVMHPLPRVNEIDPEVDFDDRAVYFRQMKYGMFVRMALLAMAWTILIRHVASTLIALIGPDLLNVHQSYVPMALTAKTDEPIETPVEINNLEFHMDKYMSEGLWRTYFPPSDTSEQEWLVGGQTRTGIFASRDISDDDELTIDYTKPSIGYGMPCKMKEQNGTNMTPEEVRPLEDNQGIFNYIGRMLQAVYRPDLATQVLRSLETVEIYPEKKPKTPDSSSALGSASILSASSSLQPSNEEPGSSHNANASVKINDVESVTGTSIQPPSSVTASDEGSSTHTFDKDKFRGEFAAAVVEYSERFKSQIEERTLNKHVNKCIELCFGKEMRLTEVGSVTSSVRNRIAKFLDEYMKKLIISIKGAKNDKEKKEKGKKKRKERDETGDNY